MSGSELNMEKQNAFIRLRQAFERGDVIIPNLNIVEEIRRMNEEEERRCREAAENPRYVPGGASG